MVLIEAAIALRNFSCLRWNILVCHARYNSTTSATMELTMPRDIIISTPKVEARSGMGGWGYWRRVGKEKHAQRREPLLVHFPIGGSLEELLFAGKAALAVEGLEAGVEVLAECSPDEVAIHHHGVVELLQMG
jgi:hypothetical protein